MRGINGDDHQEDHQHDLSQAAADLHVDIQNARQNPDRIRDRPTMVWRRLQQVDADLDRAEQHIARLLRRIDELEAELAGQRVPDQVAAAMRSHGQKLRPVRVHVDGHNLVIGVKPTGRIDPASESREWRRLVEQASGK